VNGILVDVSYGLSALRDAVDAKLQKAAHRA
jgi:hypothetical protein